MKQTMTIRQIADELRRGRSAGWSYAGARALAEFLESVEADTGEEMDLDVVAIRRDFSEYSSALEAAEEYGFEPDEAEEGEEPDDTKERHEGAAVEWLNDRTTVIQFNGGVIIQSF